MYPRMPQSLPRHQRVSLTLYPVFISFLLQDMPLSAANYLNYRLVTNEADSLRHKVGSAEYRHKLPQIQRNAAREHRYEDAFSFIAPN